MKILVITPMFPSHPQDKNCKFIYDSIRSLHDLGYEFKVLVVKAWKPRWLFKKSSTIKFEQFPDWLDIKVCKFISFPRYWFFSFSIWSFKILCSSVIKKIAFSWKCDLIHVHSELQTLTTVKVGEKLKIPVVTTIHGAETNKRYWSAAKAIISNGLKKANGVILVGKAIQPIFARLVNHSEHFRIVYNGFDTSFLIYEKNPIAWNDNLKIISVCTLSDEGKGIDLNLKALAMLKKRNIKNWNYTIVGDGCFRKDLELLTKKLDLETQVKFVGACDHDKVFDYLSKANIFCLPSYREAFGIAHLEAMACGLLVIGVQGQGPEAFIVHNISGLLVKPHDIGNLTECFHTVFINPEKMQSIAATGKKNAWENFTWSHHARQLNIFYKDIKNKG